MWRILTRNALVGSSLSHPTLDARGAQTHKYIHATAKCKQTKSAAMAPHGFEPQQIIDHIKFLRSVLAAKPLNVEDVNKAFEKVEGDARELWGKDIPREVNEDVNSARESITKIETDPAGCPETVAEQYLRVTEYLSTNRFPGRLDCHASQFNINDIVR